MSSTATDRRCVACQSPRVRDDGACVECGAEVSATVEVELPCRRCGYSLEGLLRAGACPECGAPVRLSLVGDFLAASSREHVGRLVRGAMLVEVGLYLGVLFLCVGSPVAVAVLMPAVGGASLIWGVVSLGLALLGLSGWWLVSTRDPGLREGAAGETARLALRACVMVCAAGNVAAHGGIMAGEFNVAPGLEKLITRGGAGVLGVSWVGLYIAANAYVRVLAGRIPSTGLLQTARTTMVIPVWTFLVGLPLLGVTGVLGWLTPPAGLVAILVMAGMGVAMLAWFIWYCAMVSGLRDRLETVRATMPQVAED